MNYLIINHKYSIMKKHNFYAGPSILPQYTIDKTIEGIKDFAGSGLSVLEISHRSKEFIACMNDTIALFKELLEIPAGYQVLISWRRCQPAVCYGPNEPDE